MDGALATLGLSIDDVRTAIAAANVNQSKGSFDGPLRASTLDANDQLRSAAEYANLVIAYKNGNPVRLKDVAELVDDAENLRLAAWAGQAGKTPWTACARCCRSCRPACRRRWTCRCCPTARPPSARP